MIRLTGDTIGLQCRKAAAREAKVLQRGSASLRVVEHFAKALMSLAVIRNYTVELGASEFLLVFHSNYVSSCIVSEICNVE